MPLMARAAALLRNAIDQLSRTCGPPGCSYPNPSLYQACNGVVPDSLTVTFSDVTVCSGCHDTSLAGDPPSSISLSSIDINKAFCLRASGGNTWRIDIPGNYGQAYTGASDCTGASETFNNLSIIAQLQPYTFDSSGNATSWFVFVCAAIGIKTFGNPPTLDYAIYSNFKGVNGDPAFPLTWDSGSIVSGATFDCKTAMPATSSVLTDCWTDAIDFASGSFGGSVISAAGTGGTASIASCCQCPGSGTGCCDVINVTISGDASVAGDYTFTRSGNHWNGDNGSIIHCVRGRWEMTIKSADGSRSPTWTAGDGLTSMACPPTGDPSAWGTPTLGGTTGVTLVSIDCNNDCADCCDGYSFEVSGESAAYGRSTLDTAVGADPSPCEWWRFDESSSYDKSLGRLYRDTDGYWHVDDTALGGWTGVTNSNTSPCPPTDPADWTFTGATVLSIGTSGCA